MEGTSAFPPSSCCCCGASGLLLRRDCGLLGWLIKGLPDPDRLLSFIVSIWTSVWRPEDAEDVAQVAVICRDALSCCSASRQSTPVQCLGCFRRKGKKARLYRHPGGMAKSARYSRRYRWRRRLFLDACSWLLFLAKLVHTQTAAETVSMPAESKVQIEPRSHNALLSTRVN